MAWPAAGRNAHAEPPWPCGNQEWKWSDEPMASKPARSAALACSSICDGGNSSVEAANQNWVMPLRLPASRVAQRAQLRALAPGGPAQRGARRGARGEGQRLGGVVERQRACPEVGADDLAPAPREQLVRLAAVRRAGAVAAAVREPQVGVQDGRHAGGAGPQAQVQILEEQKLLRVERTEPAQCRGAGRDGRRDRPADRPAGGGVVAP